MKNINGFKNLEITEYTLYEFVKCPLRSFMFSKKGFVSTQKNPHTGKNIKHKSKVYVPYGEILKYQILKAIYYKTFSVIKNGINFAEFKNLAMIIIAKEIKKNKKKLAKPQSHYDEIEKSIIKELEDHFNTINEFDIKDSFNEMVTLKANLRTYLQYRTSCINPMFLKKIPEVDWSIKGDPYFLLNFICLKKDNFGVSIVMTSPFSVAEEMVHRNVYISFIIQYVYYFYPKEEFEKIFGNENPNIDKLIIYYPLERKRKEYHFRDVNGVFQDVELAKLLMVYALKLFMLPMDTTACKYCEQKKFCFHRSNSSDSRAIAKIYHEEEVETKTIL